MTAVADVIPRSELPPSIRIDNSRRRKAKERRQRTPKWMRDETTLNRTLGVYRAYMQRTSLPKIAEAFSISVAQIYRDIDNARVVYQERFAADLQSAVVDQAEARRRVIEEAYTSLAAARGWRASPQRLHAEANILRVINEGEKAIEELMGLRDRKRVVDAEPEEANDAQQSVIVLDMRSLNNDGTLRLGSG